MKKTLPILALALATLYGSYVYFYQPRIAMKALYRFYLIQAGLESKTLKIGDEEFHYYEGGTGRDLILVHGFGDSKASFVQTVAHFKTRYHVILPDVPGFGDSPKLPTRNHSIHSQVERLKALTDALGIRTADWVGNSMGGHISAAMAIHHPEMVRSLVVLCPAGLRVDDPVPYREALHPLRNSEDFDLYMKQVFFRKPWIPTPFEKEFIRNSQASFEWNNRIRSEIRNGDDYLLNGVLSRIRCPTLILWGKADDIVRVVHAPEWNRLIPGSKLMIEDDSGHSPQYENPKRTAGHIESFLSSVSPKSSG